MSTHPKFLLGAAAGVIVGVAVTATLAANADGGGARTLPYSGYVDFDGQPVNAGSVGFNFALFPCPTTSQCAPLWVATGAWANGFPPTPSLHLPIFSGRFTVELGGAGQAALPDEVFLASHEVLYLAIQLEGKTLATLQKLTPSFRAITTSESDRLRVRASVEVDDPGGGSALVTADDGLVIGHSNPLQEKLLQVGADTPALVVATTGTTVSGGLAVDALTASNASVTGKLGGSAGLLSIDDVVSVGDLAPAYRAGLVFDSNDRLDGTLAPGASFVTDVLPGGRPVLSFSGGYVFIGAQAREIIRPRPNVGWTFSAWFKSRVATTPGVPLMSSYECSQQAMGVSLDNQKLLSFSFRTADDFGISAVATTPLADITRWHHVAGTRGADGKARVYVDGQLAATSAASNPGGHFSDYRILLGNEFGCAGETSPFQGELDAVRMYQRELSASEISRYFQGTRALHP
ncbi:MAG: LamG domain-containing protein [Myxococcota bacterium]